MSYNRTKTFSLCFLVVLSLNLSAKTKLNCKDRSEVTIGAVGDILPHLALQVQAMREGSYSSLWEKLSPKLNSFDIVYGNLESPIAPGVCDLRSTMVKNHCAYKPHQYGGDYNTLLSEGLSNTPLLNASDTLLQDLQESFDLLSTANNHAMDRGQLGIDQTIENLEQNGFSNRFTGTKSSTRQNDWHVSMTKNNISIAVIACTFHTNFINEDSTNVMKCYNNRLAGIPNPKLLETVEDLAKTHDAVIVTPHWGEEYTTVVDQKRKELARSFFSSGALAVFGAHPHVIQPLEVIEDVQDKLGKTKNRFIIYSLGNFIANQGGGSSKTSDVSKRTGLILKLNLIKTSGETYIKSFDYTPYYFTTSSTGPRGLRVALPFDDPYVKENSKLASHIRVARDYVKTVLEPSRSLIDSCEEEK